jgi:hypothetical protein
MDCRWAKMYLLMGHGGPICIGKVSDLSAFFFWILYGYISKTYPTRYAMG